MGSPSPGSQPTAIVPLQPLSSRLSTFASWGSLVGLAFFSIYPTTNWLTGLGSRHYSLFLADELRLPFIPQFIWLYLSMYALFVLPPFLLNPLELKRLAKELILATCISGITFLILPAHLGFARTLPADALYRGLYQGLFSVDQPFNLVPSLHVVYSTAIGLALMTRANFFIRSMLSVWLVFIVSSTVLVHQHHLLDVITGVALALLMRLLWENKID
jgi:membrane-associated phospholipid phosphatase